ncbi:MAG: ABC transporter permease [Eubacterium sp.]
MKNIFQKIYIGLVFAFLYLPIIVLVVLSFNNSKSRVIWGGLTLKWYQNVFSSRAIMEAFSTTIVLALLSGVISVILGLLGAFGIQYMSKKKRGLVIGITNIPMLNADIVTGIAMMLLFVRFMRLGFATVLIAHITFNIPYVIFCILPKMQQLDKDIYKAALDLGATPIQAFFKVILPDIFPGIMSGFLMAITMSLDDFAITYFTKGAGVDTLSTMIYAQVRRGINPEMYALSTILFAAILILLFAANKHTSLKRKKTCTGGH